MGKIGLSLVFTVLLVGCMSTKIETNTKNRNSSLDEYTSNSHLLPIVDDDISVETLLLIHNLLNFGVLVQRPLFG
ncbi:hypothetical protein ACPV5R_00005 [Vibrio astriarenae]